MFVPLQPDPVVGTQEDFLDREREFETKAESAVALILFEEKDPAGIFSPASIGGNS